MKQSVLDRRVAQVTGESIGLIRQRGFSLLLTPSNELSEKPSDPQNRVSIPSREQTSLPRA
jgi:hypothetical protein